MKIECLMHNYYTKIIVEAPNEQVAEIIALGEYAKKYKQLSVVKAFKRIRG